MDYYSAIKNLPDDVKARPQFMLTDRNKAPLAYSWQTESIYQGSKNNKAQYLSFSDALRIAEEQGLWIGYCNTPDDPFTLIDFDYKDDRIYQDTEEKQQALEWLLQSTYVEASMSGKGRHAIVRGKMPHDFNAQSVGLEAYGNGGFVALTGNVVSTTREASEQVQFLDWLAQKYVADKAIETSLELDWKTINTPSAHDVALDDSLVATMSTWSNAAKMDRLFYGRDLGEENNNASEGDLALMQAFLKFSPHDKKPEAAVRMFLKMPRTAIRYPDKSKRSNWNQYVMRTLQKAVEKVKGDEAKIVDSRSMADAAYAQAMAKQNDQAQLQAQFEIAKAQGVISNSSRAPVVQEPNPFQFFTASELKDRPPIEWVIKNVYPKKGLCAIYGESGSGKSFLALDMMVAVAKGTPWFNIKTRAMPVICLALEGAGGLRQRVMAWEQARGEIFPENILFYDGEFVVRMGKDKTEELNYTRLGQFCAALNNGHEEKFSGMIVLDTLNQASGGADENSSRDMGELLTGMKYIQKQTESLVVAVHHATKSKENQSMRGHGSFQAACDGIIEVRKVDGDLREWLTTKVKDGRDDLCRQFKLADQTLGMDADGEPIGSKVVQSIDPLVDPETGEVVNSRAAPVPMGGAKSKSAAKKWEESKNKETYGKGEGNSRQGEGDGGKNQRLLREALTHLLKSTGKFGPDNKPWVPFDAVYQEAAKYLENPNPSKNRSNAKAALFKMMERGEIQWSPDPSDENLRWCHD